MQTFPQDYKKPNKSILNNKFYIKTVANLSFIIIIIIGSNRHPIPNRVTIYFK